MSSSIRQIPKAELHRHLDGSVRFETIKDLALKHNIKLGTVSDDELWDKTKVTEQMKSLDSVIDCFWTHQKVLCSYEAIKRVTFENIEDAYYDGVKLLELRFAPTFISHNKELRNDEIIEGVLDGVAQGTAKYDIQVGLIHIVPRTLDYTANEIATDEIIRYKKSAYRNADLLCGFDLADAEANYDPEKFLPFVEKAREANLGITIHSGEDTDAKSIEKTIRVLNPKRIGHGIKAWGDLEVMNLIRDKEIMLEVCPTSNWLTNSVSTVERHPFPLLYKADILVSLNSDDPQLMNIDLSHEYKIAKEVFDLGKKDFLKINQNTVKSSFLDEDTKKHVLKKHFLH